MTSATDTYVLLRAFVDELTRCGMEDACTSPGSRSTPIALTLARERRLRCHSHIDERSSCFFAVGLAKASGLPVAVTCTSGTAAAELLPAAIEAREARVPLLLLTADRPPELREVGAGQTIDQIKIFGSAAKWFFEVGVPDARPASLRWIRTLACRAYWTALQERPGVVHLNFPLREPLLPEGPLPAETTARRDSLPYIARQSRLSAATSAAACQLEGIGDSSSAAERRLLELVRSSRRGVLVAGRYERVHGAGAGMQQDAAQLCVLAGWPLLADPLSGARRGLAAIAHYDALLRDDSFAISMRPDLVIRVGDLPTSKPLRSWLARMPEVTQIAFDPEGAWQDPDSVLCQSFALDPGCTMRRLRACLLPGSEAAGSANAPSAAVGAEEDWLPRWRSVDARASEAIYGLLAAEKLSEPAIAGELGVLLPHNATLFVASSMPVRDIESFWPVREDPPRALCNRGANGIDGTVSSAFGAAAAAAAGGGGPVVLLIGDVALAHDIGALLCATRLQLSLTIVLVNNDGGGIFDFLPVAGAVEEETYTRHIATPPELDFAAAAQLYRLDHQLVGDIANFREALERRLRSPRSGIIEVRTNRRENVKLHARAWEAAAAAIRNGAA